MADGSGSLVQVVWPDDQAIPGPFDEEHVASSGHYREPALIGRHGIVASAVVNGTDGNDNLFGTADPDVMFGGIGNDVLIGSAEGDTMYGGSGSDTADYSLATASVYARL